MRVTKPVGHEERLIITGHLTHHLASNHDRSTAHHAEVLETDIVSVVLIAHAFESFEEDCMHRKHAKERNQYHQVFCIIYLF